ncbi:spermidine/putrescine ABC transporter ATP-binding protein [Bacillus toyonensis]|nr:spermidine/putrescine ABC transporter ATP-binding protein [Bacillus toyonensis]
MIACFFYPALTRSKTPTQNSANARELGGRSTARKSPIDEGY